MTFSRLTALISFKIDHNSLAGPLPIVGIFVYPVKGLRGVARQAAKVP